MMDEKLYYKIALSLIPKIGSVLAKNLVSYTGSVEAVFSETKKNLQKIPGIGSVLSENIVSSNVMDRAKQEVEFINKHNIQTYFYLDKEYPKRLKQCNDAPLMLYSRCNQPLSSQKTISIVGTRNATTEGKELCKQLIGDLKEHQPLIVSGLAYGIDICAHKAALSHNLPTIGVLAHGLDNIYPKEHRNTAKEMLSQGGLLTEFMSGTKMNKHYFLQRNRVIAGLADMVIVIESARKGGALVTAEIANSYNREVFAFPGRTSDKYSAGCNFLIKSHRAAMIESARDVEFFMGWDKKEGSNVQGKLFYETTAEEKIIVQLLIDEGKLFIDTLCQKSGLTMNQVSSMLLSLEFGGLVKSLPGKIYTLA